MKLSLSQGALPRATNLGASEAELILIAKGALPPTAKEYRRYENLVARGIALTGAEFREAIELHAKATRKNMSPEAKEAERKLLEKYGPTRDCGRAVSNKQSVVERALAASFYRYGRGLEQPFSARGGKTISVEEYERATGRGVNDEFEQAQLVGGDRLVGPDDKGQEKERNKESDGRLPLLDTFPAYMSDVAWVFWEAIRRFDPKKIERENPNPLEPVIWAVARTRVRDSLRPEKLPHGLAKSAGIKGARNRRERILDVLEAAFQEAVTAADAAVDHFIRTACPRNADAQILSLYWPTPDQHGHRCEALPAAQIGQRMKFDRSTITRRIKSLRRRISELDDALQQMDDIAAYCRGKEQEAATLQRANRIIDRGDLPTIGPRPKVGTGASQQSAGSGAADAPELAKAA